jgi:S-(hydroxymethyl)glutathione dehydrogenase / alcohol dehydrogenase
MTIATDAAVLTAIGEPLRMQRLEMPAPGHGQALVEVEWAALCHTQLNEIRGLKGPDPYLPHTLGHEGAGTVAAIGSGVTKVKPGDRVVLTWIRGDGLEGGPSVYDGPDGPVNSGSISAFLRHAVVSENRIVPVDRELPLREAALLGCAIPTGFGMVRNDAGLAAGGTIAVFGIGGVGQAAIAGAVAAGASLIAAVDVENTKLDRARRLGATHVINAAGQDAARAVAGIAPPQGFDAAVEASGVPAAMEAAYAVIRPGGIAVIAGNAPHGARMCIDPAGLIQGKRLAGSWGGGSKPDRDTAMFGKMYRDGVLPLDAMITHEFPLDAINDAFATLAQGKAGRILISMADGAAARQF